MRSYRDSTWNKRDDRSDTFILGAAQLAWLKRELASSDATWKVIAADLPIGLISLDAIALGEDERCKPGRRFAALQPAVHSDQRRVDQTPRRRTAGHAEIRADGVAHTALGEMGKAAGGF